MAGEGETNNCTEDTSAPAPCSDVMERALILYRSVQTPLPLPLCNKLISGGGGEGILTSSEILSVDKGFLQGVGALCVSCSTYLPINKILVHNIMSSHLRLTLWQKVVHHLN